MVRDISEGHDLNVGDIFAYRRAKEKSPGWCISEIIPGRNGTKIESDILSFASSREEIELFSESVGKDVLLADTTIAYGTMYSGCVVIWRGGR